MFGFFMEHPKVRKARAEQKKLWIEQRLTKTVPWDSKIKWAEELNIQASSYPMLRLFDGLTATTPEQVWASDPKDCQDSPNGTFRYVHLRVGRGEDLQIYSGSKRGTVVFDGPVEVPALFEKGQSNYGGVPHPWMSLTPMEVLSLRGGTRLAKGVVVIAGLGLGHQLIEVSKRPKVERIILVEKSQELVDWLLPVIKSHVQKHIDVVVGDAYQELPKIKADVALVDIFDSYGNNDWDQRRLRESCFSIEKIWCWGTARITGSLW